MCRCRLTSSSGAREKRVGVYARPRDDHRLHGLSTASGSGTFLFAPTVEDRAFLQGGSPCGMVHGCSRSRRATRHR